MTDGLETKQREQHARHIAMNGADISGPIERHRAGKNSFVIDDFGEHLVLKNNEAIAATPINEVINQSPHIQPTNGSTQLPNILTNRMIYV